MRVSHLLVFSEHHANFGLIPAVKRFNVSKLLAFTNVCYRINLISLPASIVHPDFTLTV